MNVFTLRLDHSLSKQLESLCSQRGFSKTGFIKSLIRDYFSLHNKPDQPKTLSSGNSLGKFRGLVGMVSLGGNAVEDADDLFDD